MRKNDERYRADSCWNKAAPDEWLFILLGRDLAAPATIRAWVRERLRIGKNVATDQQIQDALELARTIEEEQERLRP